jgi:queuine tRNA-ribosyltransferase
MLLNIEESGATFRSYIDGNIHKLTPEDSIRVQRDIGADIILVLDECSPYEVGRDYTANSMQLTHRWAKRSIKEFIKSMEGSAGPQALYGIVQGGVYEDLRIESAEFTMSQPYFGYAVGGCLGSDSFELQDVVSMSMGALNRTQSVSHPIHLLGIGGVADIWDGVAKGIDTFDCVNPTRLARHGGAYLRPVFAKNNKSRDHVNLKNSRFREDDGPLDPECKCYTCLTFSRSYLHHLIKAGEITVIQYLAIHNVAFMNRLMENIRSAIREDNYLVAREKWFEA